MEVPMNTLFNIEDIDIKRSVLMIIDMQNDFLLKESSINVPNAEHVLAQVRRAVAAARNKGMRIVYTMSSFSPDGKNRGLSSLKFESIGKGMSLLEGSQGVRIHKDIEPREGDVIIQKHRYSAFFRTNLDQTLLAWGIKVIFMMGVTTENCVLSTARDAMFRDFTVIVLADGTASFPYNSRLYGVISEEDVKRAVLAIIDGSTGLVMETEDFVRALNVK